jgi:short-subunit dehydrogenase
MLRRYGPKALVVGASDGIGEAFASALAQRGLDLVLVARRREPLEAAAERLRTAHGVATEAVVADIGTPAGVETVTRAADGVGLLVCNAAFGPIKPFVELTSSEVDTVLDVNSRAAARLAHAIGPALLARGRGGVILLSSMAGGQGSALVAHYAATKAYLRVLAEGLWAEWRPHGVDVLACCPGLVLTPTFTRSNATRTGLLVPAPMAPERVVRAALGALGRQPVVIPGWRNRWAAFGVSRLLSRTAAVALVSRQTRALYPDLSRTDREPTSEPGTNEAEASRKEPRRSARVDEPGD